MKASVITLHTVDNYGSVMQTYATQTVRSLRKRFNVLIGWVGTTVTRVNNAPVTFAKKRNCPERRGVYELLSGSWN